MRAQIVAILLVAVVCCKANYYPGNFGIGGANYAGLGLNYASSPLVAPYSGLSAAGVPGAMKIYVVPSTSNLGNYMIVSDVAGAVPSAAGYGVVDPVYGGTDAVSRYVAAPVRYAVAPSLGTSANIATYVVKK